MSQLPTKAEILNWIAGPPDPHRQTRYRQGLRHQGCGADRPQAPAEGAGGRGPSGQAQEDLSRPGPPAACQRLQVGRPDADGDLFARPLEWHGEGAEPRILMIARATRPGPGRRRPHSGAPDRGAQGETHHYEARLIRRIGTNPAQVLGIFRKTSEGGRILPIDKGDGQGMDWSPPAPPAAPRMANWSRPNRPDPRAAWACRGRAIDRPSGRSDRAAGGVADRDPPAWHPRRFPRRGDRRGGRDETRRPAGPRGPARHAPDHDRPLGCARP